MQWSFVVVICSGQIQVQGYKLQYGAAAKTHQKRVRESWRGKVVDAHVVAVVVVVVVAVAVVVVVVLSGGVVRVS